LDAKTLAGFSLMAYDISGNAPAKAGPAKAAATSGASKAPKIILALALLSAGVYLLVAGNQGWPPFGTSVTPPAPVSASEKKLMESAPTKASDIPNIKQFEALPEGQRPAKAGS
jgi:hypothetical protein